MFTISIVVHNNSSYLRRCLTSVFNETRIPHNIYVTLNTGWNDEVKSILDDFPDVQVRVNSTPQGFAANHNAVLALAQTEYIAVLNDDVLVHDKALDILVAYLQANPDIGLVGPRLLNEDGTQQVSTYSDPTLLRSLYRVSGLASLTSQQSVVRRWLQRLGLSRFVKLESLTFNNSERDVPIIKGAVMVVRRATYTQIGGMDETTRVYGEEVDWHWRMRQAGWRVVFVPSAVVTHYGQGQAQLKLRGWILAEDRKAILHYYRKHRPRWQAELLRVFVIVTHGLYALMVLPFSRRRARDFMDVVRMALTFQS